jgi:hypothetical protein
MSDVKRQLSYKILVAMVWGLLGPLGIFHSSASAQTYIFGRADFPASPSIQTPSLIATGDFNRDGILDLAVTIPGKLITLWLWCVLLICVFFDSVSYQSQFVSND